jgi:diketogulonate reductase-like aldo/keto reductase
MIGSAAGQPSVAFPSGDAVPSLGLGTWRMGESPRARDEEIAAIRLGLDLGMIVVDTAEMYGDGTTETLVGEAIAKRRNEVFLVSKVLPSHARREQTLAACAASLERLGTDYLDLYLLHWRGRTALRETVEAFTQLASEGKIRRWGVSNFELSDMEELLATPGGSAVSCNQVLYNLRRRGIEFDLLPWCRERGIPMMAYSPVEQGELLRNKAVKRIASKVGATPAQLCLAWVLRQPNVIAIPKAGTREHVRENHASLGVQLSDVELQALDEAFPPPREARPLEMI